MTVLANRHIGAAHWAHHSGLSTAAKALPEGKVRSYTVPSRPQYRVYRHDADIKEVYTA